MKLYMEGSLIHQARRFDVEALAAIYDQYSPGIYRYAYRLLGDECLAEDCVAETFARLLRALQNGGGPRDQLSAYLYRVAHNWITDQYRREPPPPLALDEEAAAEQEGVEDAISGKQLGERLRAALVRLTPDQRQVIALKFLDGCENELIALAIQKPVGAVKALQHRALGSLRRMLISEREKNDERTG